MGGCRERHCEQQSDSEGAETTAKAAETLTQALRGWTRQEPLPSWVPLKAVGEQEVVEEEVAFLSGVAEVEAAAAAVDCCEMETTESTRESALAIALHLRLRVAAPLRRGCRIAAKQRQLAPRRLPFFKRPIISYRQGEN